MSEQANDLEALLDYLKRTRGFDFTGYKRTSLERRILKRMQSVRVASFADYLDYLEVHPEEFPGLFNTVLINVTSFFRDPSTWEFIAESVIPDLLAQRASGHPLRVWSAGCASGEEAYTLAMLFAEALGVDAFQERVKIYATDVDEEALAKARQAAYSEQEVADIPPALLKKYFEKSGGLYVFRKDLRRHVIFGRHDLIQDAPISHVDMLVCRNTLMYFNAETQAKIIARFQYALADHGVLVLGRAETLMTHTNAFTPLDLKRRVSKKLPASAYRGDRLKFAARQAQGDQPEPTDQGLLRDAAFDANQTAQLVVQVNGSLALANERARAMFGISPSDVARPLQDLKISYRPIELRSIIERVYLERRPTVLPDVEWMSLSGDNRWLEVTVVPLIGPLRGVIAGASITFHDITAAKRLQRDLEHTHQELETAYEELQSTNEELETTNEELQSTVEELETTNEELQATNEEFGTMNEELQSTNEELQTMNDELRRRDEEINRANAFLESILGSLNGAVIVVDRKLNVLLWNEGAEELWGLHEEELRGKSFLDLDIGLPTEQLEQPLRACLSGEQERASLTIDAINRRGHDLTCRVSVSPARPRTGDILGAILVTEVVLAIKRNGPGNGDRDGANGRTQTPANAKKPTLNRER